MSRKAENTELRAMPELLAPAGNLACVKAAVAAGADAVYFGGRAFNARASAGNLGTEEIREAVRLCHLRGVRCYLTLNTLIKEDEWEALTDYVRETLPLGLDAVIVQDPGVAMLVRRLFPRVELHASTQMAVHDADGARYLRDLGFSRVVLARELSLGEIAEIRRSVDIELEVFIHGALCCGYSGRCLLSSFRGGRSGNRGECAGACRLPYELEGKTCYPMNLKDLCAAEDLRALAEAGVSSFKTEGRMKGVPYVTGVISTYRRLIDGLAGGGRAALSKEDGALLAQLFNRGGFTDGYLKNDKTGMLEPRTPKHQGLLIGRVESARDGSYTVRTERPCAAGDVLEFAAASEPFPTLRVSAAMVSGLTLRFKLKDKLSVGDAVYRLVDSALDAELQAKAAELPDVPAAMFAELRAGEPSRLTLICRGIAVTAEGAEVQEASGRPLSEEDAARSLCRTGGSGHSVESFELSLGPDCFLPVSALNALRREALASLDEALLARPADEGSAEPEIPAERGENGELQIAVSTPEQWKTVLEGPLEPDVLLPKLSLCDAPETEELFRRTAEKGIRVIPFLPPVSRTRTLALEKARMGKWAARGVDAFEANHFGQLERVKEGGFTLRTGTDLGVMNSRSARFLQEAGAESFALSPELERKETDRLTGISGATLTVYTLVPLMVTEQCFFRSAKGCRPSPEGHLTRLTDRLGAELLAQSDCEACRNTLYDAQPLYYGYRAWKGVNERLSFTLEDAARTAEVLRRAAARDELPGSRKYKK